MGLMGPPVFPQDLQMLHTGQMHECGRCWGFQVKMGFVDKGTKTRKDPWEGRRDTWEVMLAQLKGCVI